jgi:2-polyprenyl-3-methyl-5-hydroxy-6-metoxy-1,4-benzoquinol methylase
VSAFRCTSSGYGHHAQIVECRHCSYTYANPRWTTEEIITAYGDVEDETYAEEREGRELTFTKHLHHMETFTGNGQGRTLLDVGAYIGVFVDIAQKAGWDACGVEPSRWGVEIAQQNNLPVIEGTLDSPELQGKQFDVVTMWDVIEHVDDPKGELEKAYALTKPGGWIVAHTMDIDSLTAKLMGRRWPWLMTMHIHYFSQKTLGQMITDVGYKVVWSGAQGRYLRMKYLVSRVGGLSPFLGKMTDGVVRGLNLGERAVPVNFGDLFTVYAQKPVE